MNTNSRTILALEPLPDGAVPVQSGTVVRVYGIDHLDRFGPLPFYDVRAAARQVSGPHAGRQQSFAQA